MNIEDTKEHLEINAMIGCKGNCKYCPQSTFTKRYFEVCNKKYKPLQLTLENCKKYLESVPKDMIISLAGYSEPLANDEIVEIYRWILNDGRKVDINTTLYNVEKETVDRIMDIADGFVQLHVPDKDNYTSIKVNREYLKLLRYFLMRVDTTKIFLVVTCLGDMHPEVRKVLLKYEDKICATNLGKDFICDRAGLIDNGIAVESTIKKGKVFCCKTIKSLNFSILHPDGTINLCCMDFGLDYVLGNLNDNTYEEIMNGDRANEVRRLMETEGAELICRKCNLSIEEDNIPEQYINNWENREKVEKFYGSRLF